MAGGEPERDQGQRRSELRVDRALGGELARRDRAGPGGLCPVRGGPAGPGGRKGPGGGRENSRKSEPEPAVPPGGQAGHPAGRVVPCARRPLPRPSPRTRTRRGDPGPFPPPPLVGPSRRPPRRVPLGPPRPRVGFRQHGVRRTVPERRRRVHHRRGEHHEVREAVQERTVGGSPVRGSGRAEDRHGRA